MHELAEAGALPVIADLETWEGAEAAIGAALDAHGRLDILINNVGGAIRMQPFERFAPEEIEAEIRRSLFPTLWCCRAALPAMRAGGVIVNVSSIATRGIHRIPYSAAKGGVNALTASLAWEAAARGIRVVATAPGGTEAPPRRIPRGPGATARRGRRLDRGGRRPDQGVEPPGPLRHRRRTGGADPLSRIRRGLLRHRRHPAGVGRRPRVSPRGDRPANLNRPARPNTGGNDQ